MPDSGIYPLSVAPLPTLVSHSTVISVKNAVLLSFSTIIMVICIQSRGPSVYLHPNHTVTDFIMETHIYHQL